MGLVTKYAVALLDVDSHRHGKGQPYVSYADAVEVLHELLKDEPVTYVRLDGSDGSVPRTDLTRLTDGRVMCCICMEYTWPKDLWVDSTAGKWDMCVPCGDREASIDARLKAGESIESIRRNPDSTSLCSECNGTTASCLAGGVKCCPDCTHTVEQLYPLDPDEQDLAPAPGYTETLRSMTDDPSLLAAADQADAKPDRCDVFWKDT